MKSFRQHLQETQQTFDRPATGDDFAINIREECLIETYVCDETADGIVLHADERMMQLLESYGYVEEGGVKEALIDAAERMTLEEFVDAYQSQFGPDEAEEFWHTVNDDQGPAAGNWMHEETFVAANSDSMSRPEAGEYDEEGDMAKTELATIIRAARKLTGMLGNADNMPEWTQKKITKAADYVDTAADYISSQKERGVMEQGVAEGQLANPDKQDSPVARAIAHRILMQHTGLLAKYGPERVMDAVDEVADFVGDVEEIGSSDVSGWVRHVEQMLTNMPNSLDEQYDDEFDDEEDEEDESNGFYVVIASETNGVFIGQVIKDGSKWREMGGVGKQPYSWGGNYMGYLSPDDVISWIRKDYRNAEVDGPFSSEDEAQQAADNLSEAKYQGREVPLGKPMKVDKFYVALDFGGGLSNIEAVVKEKGQWRYTGLRSPTYKWSMLRYSPDDVVDRLQKYYDYTDSKSPIKRSRLIVRGPFSSEDEAQQAAGQMSEAKYQGREVPLGKPMRGDVKKSKVYVRGPKGNVVKVNFGDPDMKIKKSNPERRRNFRARHNCDNPGPRWKARYWSCRAW